MNPLLEIQKEVAKEILQCNVPKERAQLVLNELMENKVEKILGYSIFYEHTKRLPEEKRQEIVEKEWGEKSWKTIETMHEEFCEELLKVRGPFGRSIAHCTADTIQSQLGILNVISRWMIVGLSRNIIPERTFSRFLSETEEHFGDTPLHITCANKSIEIGKSWVVFLCERGADINKVNKNGETPLILAIKAQQRPNFIEFLISHGAKVSCKDVSGKNALIYAKQYGHPPHILDLLKNKFDSEPKLLLSPHKSSPRKRSPVPHRTRTPAPSKPRKSSKKPKKKSFG
eukprot:TRINITY_DN2429_c0_g1_i1.p1 TRINITY_DN2429_c0_g1~~TRINITY_DN2429_c0_g1_i1.p1  ORF type:complete len:286 (-),score=38.79 TRINITY_DN2429_c0_g1_i1:60-917(-)